MLFTLHRYILRDLLRNFAFSGLALILVVTMGGGVANLLRTQGLSALEAATLFLVFIPVSATFVVPIAGMYSAAITLGRMSADNEITACRAAGINILRLYLPVVGLGLVVGLFTFYSWNFLIPKFFNMAEQMTQSDSARVATARLQKTKSIQYGNVALHADVVEALKSDPKRSGLMHLRMRRVALFRLDRSKVVTYGTADVADIHFDRESNPPEIRADLFDVRTFDADRAQYAEASHQPLGPYVLRTGVRERVSFQALPRLLEYLRDPTRMLEIADRLGKVRWASMRVLSLDRVDRALLEPPNVCTLRGADGSTLEVRCDGTRRGAKYGEIGVKSPVVIVRGAPDHPEPVRYAAQTGTINVADGVAAPDMTFVELELNVVEQGPAAAAADDPRVVRRSAVRLTRYHIPDESIREAAAIPDSDILDASAPVRLATAMEKDRAMLVHDFRVESARLHTVLHYRGALALSALGTIVLAALLGTIFRGGQVLTAFGVSCLPGFFVVMAILSGRNLGEDPNHHLIGVVLMWSVILLLFAGTAHVAARLLPR